MTAWPDLTEVKVHLRVFSDHEDADLTAKLAAAKALIAGLVTVDLEGLTEEQEGQIKAATLLVVGGLYASRGDGEARPIITDTVEHVLYGLRDPTLA